MHKILPIIQKYYKHLFVSIFFNLIKGQINKIFANITKLITLKLSLDHFELNKFNYTIEINSQIYDIKIEKINCEKDLINGYALLYETEMWNTSYNFVNFIPSTYKQPNLGLHREYLKDYFDGNTIYDSKQMCIKKKTKKKKFNCFCC